MNLRAHVEFASEMQPWLQEWAPKLDSVLEIGPDAGILALEALHLGARRAYVICANTTPAWLEQLRITNHLENRLICLNGDSQRIAPPEQVGAILFQPFQLIELGSRSSQLQSCFERWLKPDGKLAQETLDITVQPLLGQLHWQELTVAKSPLFTQLQALTRYSLNQIQPACQQILDDAMPTSPWEFNTSTRQAHNLKASGSFRLPSSCFVQGLVVGLNRVSHWWFPFSRILECQLGGQLEIELRCNHTRTGTIWSWSSNLEGTTTSQSNLFACPESLTRWGADK